MLDIAVSVYSPNGATCLVNDVVTAPGGTNSPIYKAKYEDTPDGGGAGELTLGLRYNEFYDLGYWGWRNLIEISSGDNFLTANTAAISTGTLKCYIDTIWGFDPARGEDSQLAYLNDGTNKVVRCPVQSIGFDNAPAIVNNASTTTTTAATSITRSITTPTAGHLLIAIVATNQVTTTGPSGWTSAGSTNVAGGLLLQMWYKTASGSESSVAVTFASAQTATLSVMEVAGGGAPSFAFDAAPDTQVGPALRTPVVSSTPVGSLVIGAWSIENGAGLIAPYGWNVAIPNNPSPLGATNYALGLAAVNASDLNAYQGYASWATYGTSNLAACAGIIAIPPSGTPNPWITIGMPAGGGGIPAYTAAITTVGRRRYCGMVVKRTRPNQKIPGGTVTLAGLQNALQCAIGTFNIALAAAVDVGLTCYDAFKYIPPGAVSAANFASSHFPFLTFPSSLPSPLYPSTGNLYSGNNSQISVDEFLAYAIQATTTRGDQWNLRIGHDRTPRLAKVYDGATNVYLYNLTLDQSSWSFSALNVQVVDEQDSGTYNALEVVGATGATGVQASAIVLNTTQIANLGYQIDGTPQYNTALTTTTQCAAQAQSLLESNSTASAAHTCTVYTHDDLVTSSSAPGGMQRGDVVRAGANLTLIGFPGDAPNESGLVLSAVTTLDFQKMESQQDLSFQAIVPDYRTAAAEQANALAISLIANANTLVAVDQYCVSSNARNYVPSTSSLVIAFPALLAIFAPSTSGTQAPISIATANVTCVANASNWIWLNPNGTYSVFQTNSFVTGSILMLVAQMGASGWIGDSGLKASIGVMQIGFGNINTAASIPAPTVSASPTISNGASLSGLAAAVDVSLALNNVPTDGSVSQILWLYRQSVVSGGSGNWIPFEAQNLTLASGSKYPSAVQTQSFEYDLNNGTTYDFAVAYYGLAGYGPILYVEANWTVKAVGIPNAYMLPGPGSNPTFASGATATPSGSNGLTAAMALSFTINNQPTDGSLSRISVWYTTTAIAGTWTYVGSFPATGVGTASPPASAAYTFTVDSLANGTTYGFGCTFENAQGGETSPPQQFATATAQTIAITVPYLIAGSSPTPNFSAASSIASAPALAGVALRVVLGWTINNQPTDGSLSQIAVYYRIHGGGNWSQAFAIPAIGLPTPSNPATYSNIEIPDLTAGVAYDFGIAYENAQGGQGGIASPAAWTNFTPAAIAIQNAYMIGTVASPTYAAGATATPTGSNGLTAAMALAFTPNNQPTDGSLSRISIWYTTTAVPGTWTYVGSFAASGVGTASPPASASYSFTVDGLANGTTYGFGATYENAQGGETATPTQFATATAQTIAIKQQYFIGTTSPTPTVTAVAGGIGSAPTLTGVASRVALNFSVSNQPVDGSFAGIAVYQKQHSAGTTSFAQAFLLPSSSLATPNASGTYYCEIPEAVAGIAYDYGFAFVNTQGAQSATLATPSFCQNYTAQAIAITNGYMIGTTITPTVSGTPTATNVTSGDGVSAAVQVAFTCNNQPTDGSLSRIQLWAQPHGASLSNTVGAAGFYWSPQGAQQATGVGTASPPASAAYGFVLADLTNGTIYDFAVSYENAQGGETTLLTLVSGFVAQALNIAPGQTAFSNLLTSQFLGLTVDPTTGYLTMPVAAVGIYPSTQAAALGAYSSGVQQLSTMVTFAMRFQLSNITVNSANFVSMSFLTTATVPAGSFTSGYYLTYKAGSPATISLSKIVSGAATNLLTRSAAIAATGIYPAQPAIPASDGYFHELRVVISPNAGLLVPSPGTSIAIYLDGVFICEFFESTTTAAITSYPANFFGNGGNVGGVGPYTTGTCGPGSGGYALVYLDPTDLKLTGQAAVNADSMAQQQAALVKTQAQQLALGSPTALATQSVARESIAGATGEGTNQIYNPTAARGLTGWLTGDTTGGIGVASYDGTYGGRFDITLRVATYPAVNSATSIYQFFNGAPLLPSSTYTVSGWIQVDTLQAGATVELYIAQLPSGFTGTTSFTTTTGGAQFFTFTFTTSATAMGTGTSAPYIAFEIFSGSPATTTVASVAHAYKLMLEQGAIATSFDDSYSGALVTQTHDALGNINAGLSKSTALRGQSSALPVSCSFLTTATPQSSKTSYGNNGSPTPAATYAKITCSWGAWVITYPDGTTFSFGSFSGGTGVFVSGVPNTSDALVPLAPSTSYYLTAYALYGSGTVTTAFTTSVLSQVEAAALFADGYITLVINYGPITTPAQPASGTMNGTVGNPPANTCPAVGQMMHTRRGYVLAEDLVVGDELCDWDDGTYNVVHAVRREPCEVMRVVVEGEVLLVDRNHEWAWEHGWWKTRDLRAGDHVVNADGGTMLVDSVESLGEGEYVKITCDRQRYRIGSGPVGHNNRTT